MPSAFRKLVPFVAALALAACGDDEGGSGGPVQGGPETCITKAHECDPFASCVYDEAGLPVCVCDPGFEGDGHDCVDVDECTAGTHECGEHATCEDADGGYLCRCDSGFTPNPVLDVDEEGPVCVVDDACAAFGGCGANAHCEGEAGAAACVCDAWFRADGDACVPAAPIGAGAAHGCFLQPADGSVWCWGHGGPEGIELGGPTRMGSLAGFTQLSEDGTCAFQRDGSLWCWWSGVSRDAGQLVVEWRRVGGAGGWLKTAGGWGIRAGGTLWRWDEAVLPIVPVQVGGGTDWTDVCPGEAVTCGTTRDGKAWCWAAGIEEPVQVGEGEDYVSLSCSGGMTCGLRAGGGADCWWPRVIIDGDESTLVAVPFALRAGLDEATAEPIDDVLQVSVGGSFVCALRATGAVRCGGSFGDPELHAGDPLVVDSEPWLGPLGGDELGWSAVASGASHACGIRRDSNTAPDAVHCWGANDGGQLGFTGPGTLTPVPVAFTPAP